MNERFKNNILTLSVSTNSENKTIYPDSLPNNSKFNIITDGYWGIIVDEFGAGYTFNDYDTTLISSIEVKHLVDSLLLQKSKIFEKTDTTYNYSYIVNLSEKPKQWTVVDHRSGYNEFETDWFYLPECTIRFEAFVEPFDISFWGGISLESKHSSYYVIESAWHMTRSGKSNTITLKVPAGQYFINAGIQEGRWEYRLSVYY